MRRQLCAFCVAVLVTCASWSAIAGDKEEAKQLFDAGLKLMHLDDFAGASANFERSVALYPTQNSLLHGELLQGPAALWRRPCGHRTPQTGFFRQAET
jgi:hypothetical protein